jgi:hypothetical protein
MPPRILRLESRALERAERVGALIDGFSAVSLALEARERLDGGGPTSVLGGAEILVAGLLVVVAVLALRGRSEYGPWVSGLAGVVLVLEGLSKTWGPKGHPSWALVLNGAVLLALAARAPWFDERRRARRVLTLDDDGVAFRRNRFRRFTLRREDTARLTLDTGEAVFHTRDGRPRRIDLADLHNAAEVSAAIRAWASEHAVPIGRSGDS